MCSTFSRVQFDSSHQQPSTSLDDDGDVHFQTFNQSNMGILKHVVLPILAVGHAFQAYKILVDGKEDLPKFYGWPNADDSMTPREMHLMGMILSTSLALLVNCVAAIFLENAHYRGMATLVEFIFFAAETYDAQATGFPLTVKAAYAVVSLLGLAIHSREPGIFTKDKSKTKSK